MKQQSLSVMLVQHSKMTPTIIVINGQLLRKELNTDELNTQVA